MKYFHTSEVKGFAKLNRGKSCRTPKDRFDTVDFFIVLAYVVIKVYWLRVIFMGLILLIWGFFSLVVPLYFSFNYFVEAKPFTGITVAFLSVFMIIPCWIAYKAAWGWVKRELNNKTFFRNWNANDF